MATNYDFHSLSVRDLLEAREAYQTHLINLKNVVGTGIGRFLIRRSDPDFKSPKAARNTSGDKPRTLANSDIRDWSRPCVLVFVKEWENLSKIRQAPENCVPPILYLPDGRIVHTCVVHAPVMTGREETADDILFARDLLGGGFPVLTEVQGQDRIGSIGCLVTDGHTVFALTNRHVAGPPGQKIFHISGGNRYNVGCSASLSVRDLLFSDVYPGWPIEKTRINLDAGLIEVDIISQWTSQVYGIGEIGDLYSVDSESITLDLIGRNAHAFGSVSGRLEGSVKALFYRYRTMGNLDYVTDFLIGPRPGNKTVPTRDGDSGTIWLLDAENPEEKPKPIAMQWGSNMFAAEGSDVWMEYALASNLTSICRALDVRLITDWETGLPETWGKLGHYQMGAKACDVLANEKLYKLMQKNKDLVGLSDEDRVNRNFPSSKQTSFMALADVPDLWWKPYRGKEKPGHFANLDEEGKGEFRGKTLMSLYEDDPATLNPASWIAFYESIGTAPTKQGLLPFRVKQFYEEMVGFVRKRKIAEYVAAAGILSHYIADAAQPLHTSYLHHGRNSHENGVHAQYETKMVERYRTEIVATINAECEGWIVGDPFRGAQHAAEACMELARMSIQRLSPQTIIDSYNSAGSGVNRNRDMWRDLGRGTLDCLIEGTFYLAWIWESAWVEGGGNKVPQSAIKKISKTRLKKLYKRKSFLESRWLDEM